jgi:AraC-like DNA-binding protein
MAEVAGLSPAHFSRLFKQVIGDSPVPVRDGLSRSSRRKKMLADRERSLIDVALSCGFSDQPHFNRIFKRLTGATPKEYRATI